MPDKCLNICVLATHREFWLGYSVRHQHAFVKVLFDLQYKKQQKALKFLPVAATGLSMPRLSLMSSSR